WQEKKPGPTRLDCPPGAIAFVRGQITHSIMAMEEVLEVNRLAGNWDYLLRVLVADMPAYDQFYKRLIEIDGLNDVSSSFSMEQIKYTTALPLDHL
ncbi:MAG: Lrp/AsnC ligand binding domain-containing protein, partial [Alphaproteobacteria bacterium]|nr:Lrp/AsnC ligand binding domain-containing protein [Alphaproteobacteria bacterium]